jgi:hypothetical protein
MRKELAVRLSLPFFVPRPRIRRSSRRDSMNRPADAQARLSTTPSARRGDSVGRRAPHPPRVDGPPVPMRGGSRGQRLRGARGTVGVLKWNQRPVARLISTTTLSYYRKSLLELCHPCAPVHQSGEPHRWRTAFDRKAAPESLLHRNGTAIAGTQSTSERRTSSLAKFLPVI